MSINEESAYILGYDCGMNGANTMNSHYTIFLNPKNTKLWEKGKRDAEETKNNNNQLKK